MNKDFQEVFEKTYKKHLADQFLNGYTEGSMAMLSTIIMMVDAGKTLEDIKELCLKGLGKKVRNE